MKSYTNFQHFSVKLIFFEFDQKQLILHDFSKLKKNLPKWKIWVGYSRKTGFSFFLLEPAWPYKISHTWTP